jgi:hypothetical protein
MKILLVLTAHDQLGDTGQKTGFWLEEFASPYYVFKDAGAQLTLASPKGGQPPLDPKSDEPDAQTEATKRFRSDDAAQAELAGTHQTEIKGYRDTTGARAQLETMPPIKVRAARAQRFFGKPLPRPPTSLSGAKLAEAAPRAARPTRPLTSAAAGGGERGAAPRRSASAASTT